jgi:ABC-type sugar transport system ATPase subunit
MVFQDSLLWPHLSVRGNIAFPLGPGRGGDPRVLEAARASEIDPFLDRYPGELSGGERRRAAMARAIVGRPSLLLLDEPLTGLDANLRVRLLGTIRRVQRELGVTTVYVTHDQEEALGVADHVVVMRGGRVLQSGAPDEIYARPRTAFVASFVGLSALIENGDGVQAVRPESVRLGDGTEEGEVVGSLFCGERWLLTLRAGAGDLLAWSEVPRDDGEVLRYRLQRDPVTVEDDREAR